MVVTCSIVCISHATGAGGEEVGRLVAETLDYLYVDDEIVAQAAAEGGIDPAEVADEERRKSLAARILAAMAQSGEAWALASGDSPRPAVVHGDHVRALIRETIGQTAARGKAVIVAHGASHIVSGAHEPLRVLVTASPETRAARIEELKGVDRARAAREVKDSDAARRDYLRRFYEIDEELPTHYDLVINTDRLSVEEAARLVVQAGSAGRSSSRS
jgi:cytidylate kinase